MQMKLKICLYPDLLTELYPLVFSTLSLSNFDIVESHALNHH